MGREYITMRIKGRQEDGSAAVEFAIILPVLAVLIFGIIEFGLILYDKAIITNASREGARAGIVARYDPATFDYAPLSDDEITDVVNDYCGTHLVTFGGPASPSVAVTGTRGAGEHLTVSVSYTYGFLVLPRLVTDITGPLNLSATSVMRME